MTYNRKVTGKASSIPAGLAYGTAVSILITAAGTMLIGNMIHTERLQWEQVGYGILIQILAASFLGAWTAYRKIKRQRLLVCLLMGLVYLILLLSMTALFFGGQYQAVGVAAGLILAGSGSAGLLGLKQKKKVLAGKR